MPTGAKPTFSEQAPRLPDIDGRAGSREPATPSEHAGANAEYIVVHEFEASHEDELSVEEGESVFAVPLQRAKKNDAAAVADAKQSKPDETDRQTISYFDQFQAKAARKEDAAENQQPVVDDGWMLVENGGGGRGVVPKVVLQLYSEYKAQQQVRGRNASHSGLRGAIARTSYLFVVAVVGAASRHDLKPKPMMTLRRRGKLKKNPTMQPQPSKRGRRSAPLHAAPR